MRLKITLFLALCWIFVALFAPWIFPYDPTLGDLEQKFLSPSAQHWLGTDHLGRDILSRLGYGARISLFSVFVISLLIALSSFIIGIIAGYIRLATSGNTDNSYITH